MSAENIELFNMLAGKIFADLYEEFPCEADLTAEMLNDVFDAAIAASGIPDPDPESEPSIYRYRQFSEREKFFGATVQWLIDHDYILRRQSAQPVTLRLTHPDCFYRCVLTAKGLEVLKAVPKSITEMTSWGDELTKAAKEGVWDAVKSLTSEALTKGAGFIPATIAALQNGIAG